MQHLASNMLKQKEYKRAVNSDECVRGYLTGNDVNVIHFPLLWDALHTLTHGSLWGCFPST